MKYTEIIEKLQKLNLNVECLQDILNKSFDKLFCDIKIGLVYNDLHFDNFIYDGEKLYLIDFDKCRQTLLRQAHKDAMLSRLNRSFLKEKKKNPNLYFKESDFSLIKDMALS